MWYILHDGFKSMIHRHQEGFPPYDLIAKKIPSEGNSTINLATHLRKLAKGTNGDMTRRLSHVEN